MLVSLPKGTLDGSEIRRYNQLRLLGYLPLFTRVLYIPGGDRRISSINSRDTYRKWAVRVVMSLHELPGYQCFSY